MSSPAGAVLHVLVKGAMRRSAGQIAVLALLWCCGQAAAQAQSRLIPSQPQGAAAANLVARLPATEGDIVELDDQRTVEFWVRLRSGVDGGRR